MHFSDADENVFIFGKTKFATLDLSFSCYLGFYCETCLLLAFCRSSLNGWSVGNQEAALQDVDYFSFLFSTLTGFSSESLAILQEDEGTLSPTPLSPLCLHATPLEQFTHHWDVVEVLIPLKNKYKYSQYSEVKWWISSGQKKCRALILRTLTPQWSLSVPQTELRGGRLYHCTPAERRTFIALHRLEIHGCRA